MVLEFWWVLIVPSTKLCCYVRRVHGGYDIEPGIRVQKHIFEERDEGEVCQWYELLCLSVYVVSTDPNTICHCRGGPQGVGRWMEHSSCTNWSQFCLVIFNYLQQSVKRLPFLFFCLSMVLDL